MAPQPEVFAITGVTQGTTESQKHRQRRYLISMSIRTICWILAIVTNGWLRWVFFVGALLLPYFAVVIANAGRERRLYEYDYYSATEERRAITTAEKQ